MTAAEYLTPQLGKHFAGKCSSISDKCLSSHSPAALAISLCMLHNQVTEPTCQISSGSWSPKEITNRQFDSMHSKALPPAIFVVYIHRYLKIIMDFFGLFQSVLFCMSHTQNEYDIYMYIYETCMCVLCVHAYTMCVHVCMPVCMIIMEICKAHTPSSMRWINMTHVTHNVHWDGKCYVQFNKS